jgi:hypothetical protein
VAGVLSGSPLDDPKTSIYESTGYWNDQIRAAKLKALLNGWLTNA